MLAEKWTIEDDDGRMTARDYSSAEIRKSWNLQVSPWPIDPS